MEPYDPMCETFAKDMTFLDMLILEHPDDDPETITPEMRAGYIILNEGTYNRQNGHFLCDACYIKAGMPSSPFGWVCP